MKLCLVADVSGTAAGDVEPPVITVETHYSGSNLKVSLSAEDSGSGVAGLFYSLDGAAFESYLAPFEVDVAQYPTLYLFADDNVANRGSRTVNLLGQPIFLPLVVH